MKTFVTVLMSLFMGFLLGVVCERCAELYTDEKPEIIGDIGYLGGGHYTVVDARHPVYCLEGRSYRGDHREPQQKYVFSEKSLGVVGRQHEFGTRMRR